MRLRIIQLEDELSEQPPKKRARKSDEAATSAPFTSNAAPSAASVKADEKKRKMEVKKVFDRYVIPIASAFFATYESSRLKKECKSDTVKFQGSSKTIKFDEVYEQGEFELLYGGKGLLIQPTPQNKPKSAVTIIHFVRSLLVSSPY
jgi:hypothetical protein